MPLSFRSQNHGSIAFGFFNIESDMLLLEHYFFFADDFCKWMMALADQEDEEPGRLVCPVYNIVDSKNIGDLMGAIHGILFTGFIGQVYTLFPFPDDPKAFKQNPEGFRTREVVQSQIKAFSAKTDISIELDQNGQAKIGFYEFEKTVFHELIQYVFQGGYPRWKEGRRPAYVTRMKACLEKSNNPFFQGLFSS